jgi:hypothetical protein
MGITDTIVLITMGEVTHALAFNPNHGQRRGPTEGQSGPKVGNLGQRVIGDRMTLSCKTDSSPGPPLSFADDDLGHTEGVKNAKMPESIVFFINEDNLVKCPIIGIACSKEVTVDTILDTGSEVNLLTEGFMIV